MESNAQKMKQPKQKIDQKQKQLENACKPKKILKFALQSPYLNYYEVMPAKPGKDFVGHQLTKVLQSLHSTLPPMLLKTTSSDAREVSPPPAKRQRTTVSKERPTV
jgi:hypothetical protein